MTVPLVDKLYAMMYPSQREMGNKSVSEQEREGRQEQRQGAAYRETQSSN